MASDSLSEALDAVEAALDAANAAGADVPADMLVEPVKALNAAAKEALR